MNGFTFYAVEGSVQYSQNLKILNPDACKDGIRRRI